MLLWLWSAALLLMQQEVFVHSFSWMVTFSDVSGIVAYRNEEQGNGAQRKTCIEELLTTNQAGMWQMRGSTWDNNTLGL